LSVIVSSPQTINEQLSLSHPMASLTDQLAFRISPALAARIRDKQAAQGQ
jgi:hypothetical protein